MSKGRFTKRCGCRGDDAKQLGASCPKLTQRNHGAWSCVVDVPSEGGKRRQLTKGGFRTKGDAEAWRDDVLKATERGATRINPRLTVGEWLAEWLAEKTRDSGVSAYGKTVRSNTATGYRLAVRYLTEQLGHVRLSELTASHIAAAYERMTAAAEERAREVEERQELANAALVANGKTPRAHAPVRRLGPTTLARVHACLRTALQAAVRAGYKPFNPCHQVTLPSAPRRVPDQWTPEQLWTFLESVAGHRMGMLFEVIAAAGLRRGEALALRWSDVDVVAGSVQVERQLLNVWGEDGPVFGVPKSSNGLRVVALPASTVDALKLHRLAQDSERDAWHEAYDDFGLVFCQENGRPYDPAKVTKTFSKLAKEAGLPHIRLHDVRHAAATRWIANGVPVAVVSKRLGHSSISITVDTYAHREDEADRRAAEAGWSRVIPEDPHVSTM